MPAEHTTHAGLSQVGKMESFIMAEWETPAPAACEAAFTKVCEPNTKSTRARVKALFVSGGCEQSVFRKVKFKGQSQVSASSWLSVLLVTLHIVKIWQPFCVTDSWAVW